MLALLLATCKTNGASVAVDSKDSHVTATESYKESAKETSYGDDNHNPRIGLYMQKVDPYGTVGPIGGNQAFFLTSLPSYGNPDCSPQVQIIDVNWKLIVLLMGSTFHYVAMWLKLK